MKRDFTLGALEAEANAQRSRRCLVRLTPGLLRWGGTILVHSGEEVLSRELRVDENQAPTSHAEARDPAWSNYKWNHTDIIEDMTGAPRIVDNKAELGLLIAARATSAPDPVPAWMNAKDLTWSDGEGKVHGWAYRRVNRTSSCSAARSLMTCCVTLAPWIVSARSSTASYRCFTRATPPCSRTARAQHGRVSPTHAVTQ
jgi:hypothetical protein